ncbi:MAG: PQQ-like beta-propeller repeat protein, partial [Desulfobacterales bacterium]|nr:PQQ-like beta-propeller repeat protein [Desulfobacterales bacterium]
MQNRNHARKLMGCLALFLIFVILPCADAGAADGEESWCFDVGSPIQRACAIGGDGTILLVHGQNLTALNPDGSVKWIHGIQQEFTSPPVIGPDGTIHARSGASLHAVDPDGTGKWVVEIGSAAGADGSAPAIGMDGTIYASGDSKPRAINPDGSTLWIFDSAAAVNGSPAIGAGGAIFVHTMDGRLIMLDKDGVPRREVNLGAPLTSSFSIGPDGTLFAARTNSLVAFEPDGSLKFEFQAGAVVHGPPAVDREGGIYFSVADNRVLGLNPDGSLKWTFQTQSPPAAATPAIGSDGAIHAAAGSTIHAIRREDGVMIWSTSGDNPGDFQAALKIGPDGLLLAGDAAGRVHAIETSSGGPAHWGWPMAGRDPGGASRIDAGAFHLIVETDGGRALAGLGVYLFEENGSYTGVSAATNAAGAAAVEDFQEGLYQFRVDYMGRRFWSSLVDLSSAASLLMKIHEEAVAVTVAFAGGPAPGANIYLFSGAGAYLGQTRVADASGAASFLLPADGEYQFRADLFGSQYWSAPSGITDQGPNAVFIDAGGGSLDVKVQRDAMTPMEGRKIYLFNSAGSGFLGKSETTDASGEARFHVPEGGYKVRVDYLGGQFWSDEIPVASNTNAVVEIEHQPVQATVQGVFQGAAAPVGGAQTYLFNEAAASYQGRNITTDANGVATYHLPERPYTVRANYLGRQFWSAPFTWQDAVVNIPLADVEIRATGAGAALEGVNIYVFSPAGSYLGIHQPTGADGKTTFRLPAGAYLFRADHQGGQYWSQEEILTADMTTPVEIS